MARFTAWMCLVATLLLRLVAASCTLTTTKLKITSVSTKTYFQRHTVTTTLSSRRTTTYTWIPTDYIIKTVTAKPTNETSLKFVYSTTTLTSFTKSTLKAPSTVTFTCPQVPLCSTYTTVTVTSPVLSSTWTQEVETVTTTVSTYAVYVRSRLVKHTITSGSPPTTKVVTSTVTRDHATTTITTTPYRFVRTETQTLVDTETATVARTRTHVATPTIYLFSARIDLTNTTLDGYTLGAGDERLTPQHDSVFTLFIDPETKALTEFGTGRRYGWYYDDFCDEEGCFDNSENVAILTDEEAYEVDGLGTADSSSIVWTPSSCFARCGEMIRCYYGLDNVGVGRERMYAGVANYTDVDPPHDTHTFGESLERSYYNPLLTVQFRAVGPSKGK